jgi:hypothetical protein
MIKILCANVSVKKNCCEIPGIRRRTPEFRGTLSGCPDEAFHLAGNENNYTETTHTQNTWLHKTRNGK